MIVKHTYLCILCYESQLQYNLTRIQASANSEGPGESAHMRWHARAFAARVDVDNRLGKVKLQTDRRETNGELHLYPC